MLCLSTSLEYQLARILFLDAAHLSLRSEYILFISNRSSTLQVYFMERVNAGWDFGMTFKVKLLHMYI